MANRDDEGEAAGKPIDQGELLLNAPLRLNIGALQHAEQGYRRILLNDPGVMGVRVDLAWCLFMQALLLAVQESVNTTATTSQQKCVSTERSTCISTFDSEARALLKECLQQTITVTQLSRSHHDRLVIEKLQALVKLVCGEQETMMVEDTAKRILAEITLALQDATDPPFEIPSRAEPDEH